MQKYKKCLLERRSKKTLRHRRYHEFTIQSCIVVFIINALYHDSRLLQKRTIMCTLNVYNNNNRKKVKSKTPCFFKFLVQRIFFFLFIAKKIAFPPNYFNTVFFLCEIITRIQFKLAFLTQNNANRQKNHYNFSLPTETFHCTLHSIRQFIIFFEDSLINCCFKYIIFLTLKFHCLEKHESH